MGPVPESWSTLAPGALAPIVTSTSSRTVGRPRDRDALGERLVRFFFSTWDAPDRRPVIVGLLRAALSGEDAAGMLRQFLARALFGRIAEALDADDPELRANLAAAQLGGVALLRYVLQVEPLASADVEELVPMLAPVIQHHLTAPLP